MTDYLTQIRCLECGADISTDNILVDSCPNCGSAWLDAQYDYEAIAARWQNGIQDRDSSLWRYQDLLPVKPTLPEIPMGEGYTPLYRLIQYERQYQHHGKLYIKDERVQPTNSFKDRQAALSVMAMAQAGVTECVLASTGNAAVAYAAYCARAGIKLWLFLTSLVPPEKMREAALYGCEVIKVSGTYDETKKVAAEFAKHKGIRFDKGAKSVPGKEAMKTLGYEIAEQLGIINGQPDNPWQAPDWYIQAVSGGIGPIGVWKGFEELYAMGLIDRMPKLAIIQASGCSPMVQAFHAGKESAAPVVPQTLVHVLATGDPGHAYKILREACLSNGGTMLPIDDGETFAAMRHAASFGGLSVEPATAVAFAGLEKMLQEGIIQPEETAILNCSGHTFPVESHILGNQYEEYILELKLDSSTKPITEGLGAALQTLDEKVTTIVIVDDNPDDRRLIRRLLKSYKQYRIYEAQDGQHALSVIQEHQPDLIITDLMMPNMDGMQLIETLKQDASTATIPVVVATAKTLTEQDRERLDQQAQSVWQKAGMEPRALVQDVISHLEHEPISIIDAESIDTAQNSAKSDPIIVVIDDNPLDLRLARRIIASSSTYYQVIDASTGEDGLAAIKAHRPDLIILDINLPDMDGFGVIEHLQADETLRDLPVVVYSAHDMTLEERSRIRNNIRRIMKKSGTNRQRFLDVIEEEID